MLSSTLFNLYIDRLLVILKNSGLGCHINGTYMGALSYADDITLSCPSVLCLNKMMIICSDLDTKNFITFNAKQTIFINRGICKTNQTCYIRWQCYIMAHWS